MSGEELLRRLITGITNMLEVNHRVAARALELSREVARVPGVSHRAYGGQNPIRVACISVYASCREQGEPITPPMVSRAAAALSHEPYVIPPPQLYLKAYWKLRKAGRVSPGRRRRSTWMVQRAGTTYGRVPPRINPTCTVPGPSRG